MEDNKPTFSFKPLRPCKNSGGGRLWEVEVTKVKAGDYHRVGDVVIVELR